MRNRSFNPGTGTLSLGSKKVRQEGRKKNIPVDAHRVSKGLHVHRTQDELEADDRQRAFEDELAASGTNDVFEQPQIINSTEPIPNPLLNEEQSPTLSVVEEQPSPKPKKARKPRRKKSDKKASS